MPLHMSARPADKTVKFSITTHIAFPSPILNVHFIVAEILSVSGMGESIDRHFRDLQDIACFCEDGSTDVSSLLSVALVHAK